MATNNKNNEPKIRSQMAIDMNKVAPDRVFTLATPPTKRPQWTIEQLRGPDTGVPKGKAD